MADEIAVERLAPPDAHAQLVAEIARWRWVKAEHIAPAGGTELRARGKLFGHVLDYWTGDAAVGLAVSRGCAEAAIADGAARLHPIIDEPHWVLIVLHTARDMAHALDLARAAYARAVPPLRLV
jgi:hypothetical protein